MEDAPRLRCGMQLEYMQFYPMKSEWQTLETLEDFLPKLQNGVMYGFFSDNAKSKLSTAAVKHIECIHCVDVQSEPHYQHQNPAECKMSNGLETTSYIMLEVQPCTHCSDEMCLSSTPIGIFPNLSSLATLQIFPHGYSFISGRKSNKGGEGVLACWYYSHRQYQQCSHFSPPIQAACSNIHSTKDMLFSNRHDENELGFAMSTRWYW